jgi:hypothetical protein
MSEKLMLIRLKYKKYFTGGQNAHTLKRGKKMFEKSVYLNENAAIRYFLFRRNMSCVRTGRR